MYVGCDAREVRRCQRHFGGITVPWIMMTTTKKTKSQKHKAQKHTQCKQREMFPLP